MRKHVPFWYCLSVLVLGAAGCGSSDPGTTVTARSASGFSLEKLPKTPAAQQAASASPKVLFRTSMGDVVIQLNAEKAPLTVKNFLAYVDSGHYVDTIFHQVREGNMILGGGYTAEMTAKPVRETIYNEAHNGLSNKRGTIAMARQPDVINSSTCQFFFNLEDNSDYLDHIKSDSPEPNPADYGYCVFGEVVEGMDVLDKISKVEVTSKQVGGETFNNVPKRVVKIHSAKRWH